MAPLISTRCSLGTKWSVTFDWEWAFPRVGFTTHHGQGGTCGSSSPSPPTPLCTFPMMAWPPHSHGHVRPEQFESRRSSGGVTPRQDDVRSHCGAGRFQRHGDCRGTCRSGYGQGRRERSGGCDGRSAALGVKSHPTPTLFRVQSRPLKRGGAGLSM
jgi:hypothetical protein